MQRHTRFAAIGETDNRGRYLQDHRNRIFGTAARIVHRLIGFRVKQSAQPRRPVQTGAEFPMPQFRFYREASFDDIRDLGPTDRIATGGFEISVAAIINRLANSCERLADIGTLPTETKMPRSIADD